MTDDADLKALERKAFRSTFEDGLMELLLGFIFLAGGAGSLLPYIGISRHWISAIVLLMPLLFIVGKKRITVPRMGKVKFSSSRRAAKKKLLAVVLICQLITWIIFMLSVSHHFPGPILSGTPLYVKRLMTGTVLFFLPFSCMAYILNYPRLYILAIMASLGESLYEYLQAPWNGLLTQGITGLVFILIGGFLLARFMRKYPLPGEAQTAAKGTRI